MESRRSRSSITWLVLIIAGLTLIATSSGIFSNAGPGPSTFLSVHGEEVRLYGKGVYRNMSAEVAPQGIAQDYVTLFLGIPILLISYFFYRKGSLAGKIVLTGTMFYFLVTYVFFTMMALFNQLYLVWVSLIALSFFSFIQLILSFNLAELEASFAGKVPSKFIGGFLMFNGVAIGLLWLSVVVPPLIDSTYPDAVEHYTTLVVQALDLSILLPCSFISGYMIFRKHMQGYLLAPVYAVFLSFMLLALLAKIVAMAASGYQVIPAVFIIPFFAVLSLICVYFFMKALSK